MHGTTTITSIPCAAMRGVPSGDASVNNMIALKIKTARNNRALIVAIPPNIPPRYILSRLFNLANFAFAERLTPYQSALERAHAFDFQILPETKISLLPT